MSRLKGLFSKWHCKNCNQILNRNQVKYQSEFRGHYSTYWYRCLNCGCKGEIKPINERIQEIIVKEYKK